MADLNLNEPAVRPVLGQMRDIRVPQAMRRQDRRQAKGVPVR